MKACNQGLCCLPQNFPGQAQCRVLSSLLPLLLGCILGPPPWCAPGALWLISSDGVFDSGCQAAGMGLCSGDGAVLPFLLACDFLYREDL